MFRYNNVQIVCPNNIYKKFYLLLLKFHNMWLPLKTLKSIKYCKIITCRKIYFSKLESRVTANEMTITQCKNREGMGQTRQIYLKCRYNNEITVENICSFINFSKA